MSSADADAVPTLRELIQRHIDRTGHSQRHIADMSGVSRTTLTNWMAGKIPGLPEPETIRRFAAFTGYTEQTVVLAAAKTIGLRVAEVGGRLVNSLPPGTDNLSVEDIDAIRGIVRQLIDARRPTPTGPDLSRAEGLRLAPEEGTNHDTRTGR